MIPYFFFRWLFFTKYLRIQNGIKLRIYYLLWNHNYQARDARLSKKSRKVEVRKITWNFLFCFDFTINSKYVILFHFESANIWKKIREKKISGSFYLQTLASQDVVYPIGSGSCWKCEASCDYPNLQLNNEPLDYFDAHFIINIIVSIVLKSYFTSRGA